MRILFAGSPDVALPCLEAVSQHTADLFVLSQPDKPVGRKRVITPTAVSRWALDRGVPLFRPATPSDIAASIVQCAPDVAITVAYGRILRPDALAIPTAGWWNVHFSLLPQWRGAAPVNHALLAGDRLTGVTVFQLDEGIDEGPVLGHTPHPIRPGITAGELLGELAEVAAELLTHTLIGWQNGALHPTPQEGSASFAPKLTRETGRIVAGDSVEQASRRFQAATPEPGCFFTVGGGAHQVGVLGARVQHTANQVGDGTIESHNGGVGIRLSDGHVMLERVHPSGKKPMTAGDWWRGIHGLLRIDD